MNGENQQEHWQIEVGGRIYDAVLAELPEWINEGSLHPEDKVRKGNLRWIEARKVPSLVPFFNAKEKGEPLPVIVQTYTEVSAADPLPEIQVAPASVTTQFNPPILPPIPTPRDATPQTAPNRYSEKTVDGSFCAVHAEIPSFYICNSCCNAFCKGCPKSFGGNVKICPNCDAMCTPINHAAESNKRKSQMAVSAAKGFGTADFTQALAYPFRFKSSLIFGGLMFMFFTLGQSAAAIGGIFMIVAAIFCAMLANTLTFGVLANTVENFTQGRIDSDFMPSFDDFSTWDDVIHPFFLSIGAYISSFGPFILVMVIGVYLIVNSANTQAKKFQEEISRVPGTEYYAPDRTLEQTQQVKNLIERAKQQNDRRLARQEQIERGETPALDDRADDIARSFEDGKEGQIQTEPDQPALAKEQQYAQVAGMILRLAAPLVIIGLIAFMWGIFYFPAACAVAGYSRSFMETINPLVGIDTIRRLGFDYVKVLLMCLCIVIASVMIAGILNAILAPLNLPKMGNIPAKVVGSLFGFYFSIVFSCVLGFAMFKAGDRLKLPR